MPHISILRCEHSSHPPIPKTGISKNKFRNRGVFSNPKIRPSTHHNSPRFHHKFTTKKPPSTTRFRQNPLQKHKNSPRKKSLNKNLAGSPHLDLGALATRLRTTPHSPAACGEQSEPLHSKRRAVLEPQPGAIKFPLVSNISSLIVSVNSSPPLSRSITRVNLCVAIQTPAGLNAKAPRTPRYRYYPPCAARHRGPE